MVDLETTGTNPYTDAITEIGAVRVVGGEVVEEFQTFVNPQRDIPASIARLTGITNHMVHNAPSADAVIPAFLEFARTSVLVAHNARFDVGFLKAAAARLGYRWPPLQVVDTLTLARRTFRRDEVPNHKLGTLAAAVGATTVPNHRALSDARATADVLHEMIARLSGSATHLSDLIASQERANAAQIRKRHLAHTIPAAPGVYSFVDAQGHVLYVGKSLNLRSRVRTYFTAQEKRRAIVDMMPAVERVECLVCASEAEAAVREVRLIATEKPRANRQGIRPTGGNWLRLGPGAEGLRLARKVTDETDGCTYIGPLRSRHEVEPIRSLVYSMMEPSADFHARLRDILVSDPSPLLTRIAGRMREHTVLGQYEKAAALRENAELLIRAASRASMLRSVASVPLIVAARKVEVQPECLPPGTDAAAAPWMWEVYAIRYGRLLDTRVLPAWEDPLSVAPALQRSAAEATEEPSPLAFGHHHETELICQWLQLPGTRIVHLEGHWSVPAGAAWTLEALTAHFARTGAGEVTEVGVVAR